MKDVERKRLFHKSMKGKGKTPPPQYELHTVTFRISCPSTHTYRHIKHNCEIEVNSETHRYRRGKSKNILKAAPWHVISLWRSM